MLLFLVVSPPYGEERYTRRKNKKNNKKKRRSARRFERQDVCGSAPKVHADVVIEHEMARRYVALPNGGHASRQSRWEVDLASRVGDRHSAEIPIVADAQVDVLFRRQQV